MNQIESLEKFFLPEKIKTENRNGKEFCIFELNSKQKIDEFFDVICQCFFKELKSSNQNQNQNQKMKNKILEFFFEIESKRLFWDTVGKNKVQKLNFDMLKDEILHGKEIFPGLNLKKEKSFLDIYVAVNSAWYIQHNLNNKLENDFIVLTDEQEKLNKLKIKNRLKEKYS